jgi:hypothetical protein
MSHTMSLGARACAAVAPARDAPHCHTPNRRTRIFVVTRLKFVTEVIQSNVSSVKFGDVQTFGIGRLGIGSFEA